MKKFIFALFALFLLVPTLAYAQGANIGAAVGDSLFDLAKALVAPVTGVLSMYLFAGVKKMAAFVNTLHANVQRLLVVVVAWVLGIASSVLNVALPDNLAALDISSLETAVAAGFAMLLHEANKRRGK